MTAHWKKTHLTTILSRYKLQGIFNGDEFGLFFQALPNKTLELKDEKYTGEKHSKVRFTGLSAASAAGEKLPIHAIEKTQKSEVLQEREVLTVYVQGTNKKLYGLGYLHGLDKTGGWKIPNPES